MKFIVLLFFYFQVDGKHNPKIQSIFLDKFPIHTAHFSRSGEEVIMGSTHSSFHCYDMMAGKVVRVPTIKGTSVYSDWSVKFAENNSFVLMLS